MIRIKTGYRDNQFYVIPEEEAHVAYYLFSHDDAKAIFSNGVALRGKDILGIEPAWNEIMGWNPTHELDDDDWNYMRSKDVDRKARERIEVAKLVSMKITPSDFRIPLSELEQRFIGTSNNKCLTAKTI